MSTKDRVSCEVTKDFYFLMYTSDFVLLMTQPSRKDTILFILTYVAKIH